MSKVLCPTHAMASTIQERMGPQTPPSSVVSYKINFDSYNRQNAAWERRMDKWVRDNVILSSLGVLAAVATYR